MSSCWLFLYILLIFNVISQNIIPLSCITRTGPLITGIGQTSQISCQLDETLVSCGIFGEEHIGGTWVDNATCIALANHNQYQVAAKARCCIFPSDAIASVSTKSSISNGAFVSSTCSVGTVLTGCQVYYASGAYSEIQGSFAGPGTSTPQTNTWISTDNQCNAVSYGTGTVMSMATCLNLNYGYLLECKTKAKLTILNNFGQCEAGYIMIACNGYTETPTLDKYYINHKNECFVQQDYNENMYANAICCRLLSTITSNPTVYPTTHPTIDPTTDPTIDPTTNPSTNPTAYPTTNPTLYPTNPTNIPSSNPTTTTQSNDIQVQTTPSSTEDISTSRDTNRSDESSGMQLNMIAMVIGICGLVLCCIIILIIVLYKKRKEKHVNNTRMLKPQTVDDKSTADNQTNKKPDTDIEDMFNTGNNMETPIGSTKTLETPIGGSMKGENGENVQNVDEETLPNNEDEQSNSSDDMFEQGVDTVGAIQMTTVR